MLASAPLGTLSCVANIQKYPPKRGDTRQRDRWRARWRDPSGRTQSKVFDRKADAERWLTGIEHRKHAGEYVDHGAGKITLKEWCEAWRERQVHRASTSVQVESYLRNHVYPVLGDRPLSSLRPSDIQGWVATASQKLAPGSVETCYRHLSSALSAAERDRIIGRSPCQQIKLPKQVKAEIVPPTEAQVAAILDAVKGSYRCAVMLGAGAGLRLGEVFGVQVDRIDFDAGTLRVDQQLVTPGEGRPFLGPPKTPASVRTVPLAPAVLEEIRAHMRSYPPLDGYSSPRKRAIRCAAAPFRLSGLERSSLPARRRCGSTTSGTSTPPL
jgi:integrase